MHHNQYFNLMGMYTSKFTMVWIVMSYNWLIN